MKKHIAAAAAALTCLAASAGVYAYSFYPLERASAPDTAQQLLALNEHISQTEGDYDPAAAESAAEADNTAESAAQESGESGESAAQEAPPESAEPAEPAEDFVELCAQRLALSQEYYDALYAQGGALRTALIDYDVALRELGVLREKCAEARAALDELTEQYRFGGAAQADVNAAQAAYDGLYYDLRAALFDIGAKKSEIESLSGEPLDGGFDYGEMYFITDALAIDADALADMSQLGALVTLSEQERREAADVSEPYNAAVSAYYALGGAMRDYAAAALSLKTAEDNVRLALGGEDEVTAARTEKNAAYLAAVRAKAEYAKALMALDGAVGGALTGNAGADLAISGELSAAVASAERGEGLWKCALSGGKTYFVPIALPEKIAAKDSGYDGCVITYAGRTVAQGVIGAALEADCGEFSAGETHAQVTFTKKGAQPIVYEISVLAPFGGFTERKDG